MAETVMYKGEPFRIQTSGRYFQSGRKTVTERLLHRRIWSEANGPIQKGFHIHHKDGDWRNNDIANLQLIERRIHQRGHMIARNRTEEGMKSTLRGLKAGRDAAAKWHSSNEGREFHSKMAADAWKKRNTIQGVCVYCSSEFEKFFARAKFCSNSCQQKAQYRRRKASR